MENIFMQYLLNLKLVITKVGDRDENTNKDASEEIEIQAEVEIEVEVVRSYDHFF